MIPAIITAIVLGSTVLFAAPNEITSLAPTRVVAAFDVPVVKTEPSIQERAQMIAVEYGISFAVMDAVIRNESNWQIDPPGHNDGGDACGIVQINKRYWPEEHKKCYDVDFALRFLAKHIKAGDHWKYWTTCSCVSTARVIGREFGITFPRISDPSKLDANSPVAIGVIALFNYNGKWHMAIVTAVEDKGFWIIEGNFRECDKTRRFIEWSDPNFEGFHDTQKAP